jgi:hypothetical protein
MKAASVNSWLSVGANIGVVIGLLLVAFQIKQDADLTKVQLFSDHTDSRREWNQAMMGSNPMEVVAKSIERPHELTLAELQVMDMYFVAAINELRRLELLRQTGLETDASVEGLQSFYFGSNFAKAWYTEYGGDDEFRATDATINAVNSDWLVNFFDRVLAGLGEDGGQSLSRDEITVN